MADKRRARINGKFAPGVSGNPNGRPRKEMRIDAADLVPAATPAPRRAARRDGFVNRYSGHGTSRDRRRYTEHQTQHISDLTAIDLRRGNWLAKRICEALDDDAFRRAYTMNITDQKLATKVRHAVRRLGINAKAKWAGQMERTCGGAALLPIMDGALGDLSEPLDLDSGPRIVKVHGIIKLEPRELTPVDWYEDVTHPKFGQPETYRLNPLSSGGGSRALGMAIVHESRMAIYVGEEITRELQHGQRTGWKDSILNPVAEVIFDYGLSWGSIATILHNFSQRVYKFNNLAKLLSNNKNGERELDARVRAMDMVANVLNGLPLDSEDDMVQVAMSVAGLSDLMIQQAQVVSAAAEMPMTRLYGTSPKGMNATGEYDDKSWDDRVITRQDDHTDPIEWLIKLELMSTDGPTGGKVPEDFAIEWLPLDNPSEKEDAETRDLTSQTDERYYNMGMPAETILKARFGGKKYSRETPFDQAAFDAQKDAADELAQQEAQAQRDALDVEEAARDGRPRPGAHPDAEESIRRKQPAEEE